MAVILALAALACLSFPKSLHASETPGTRPAARPPAASPLAPAEEPMTRAVLAVTVNDRPAGEVQVLMIDDEVWIDLPGLKQLGIKTIFGQRRREYGTVFVAMSTLAPDVAFTFDQDQLELRLKVAPALLGKTILNAAAKAPAPSRTASRAKGAFVNYAANWRDRGAPRLFAETAFSASGALVSSTLYTVASGRLMRGLSQAVFDDARHLNRWTLGDRIAYGGELGGALMLGGVSLAREYGIDPSLLRYPTLNVAGAVSAPATVEVYANGQLVQRRDLPPGQFEVKSLPVSAGRGTTRVIVRDAFGRTQEFGAPYYVSTSLLSKGLQDYVYSAGFERERPADENWRYTRLVGLMRHRFGVTDNFTAGVRAEGTAGLFSGGPSLNWRFRFGEVELGAAGSRTSEGRVGAAGVVGYRYLGRRLTLGSVFRSTGRAYETLGSRYDFRPAIREADFAASVRVGNGGSVSFRHVQSTDADVFGGTRSSVTVSTRTAGAADVFGTVARRAGANGGMDLVIGLTRTFGATGLHVYRDVTGDGPAVTSAEVSRSAPAGTGYGYRAGWRDAAQHQASGLFEYQSDYGRYEASAGTAGGAGSGAAFSAAGAVVAVGGRVYATRSIQDSYALVRVPNAPGVRVFASHQEIGRTDRRGDLLVPNLQSYSVNELSIADGDVPLDNAVESADRSVVPSNRGAAVVVFPVRRLSATTGSLELMTPDGIIVPAFGVLNVETGTGRISSPIGRGGEFYLENVPAGAHRAVITANGRRCEFTLTAAAAATAQADLGLLRCTIAGRTP